MTEQSVLYEARGAVALVTLNRPQSLNSFTRAMHAELWRALDRLDELEAHLKKSGIELRFAELKDPVKDKLKRFELFERFGADNFYPTIGAAVDAYLAAHKISWKA